MLEAGQRSLENRSSVLLVDVTAPPKVPDHFFVHPLAAIDDGARDRRGHAHLAFQPHSAAHPYRRDCSFGQNVMVGPDVTVGDGCKIQNNVSALQGRDAGGRRVLRAVLRLHQRQ